MEGLGEEEEPRKVNRGVMMAERMFWRERLGCGVQLCSEVRLRRTEKKPVHLETRPQATCTRWFR